MATYITSQMSCQPRLKKHIHRLVPMQRDTMKFSQVQCRSNFSLYSSFPERPVAAGRSQKQEPPEKRPVLRLTMPHQWMCRAHLWMVDKLVHQALLCHVLRAIRVSSTAPTLTLRTVQQRMAVQLLSNTVTLMSVRCMKAAVSPTSRLVSFS